MGIHNNPHLEEYAARGIVRYMLISGYIEETYVANTSWLWDYKVTAHSLATECNLKSYRLTTFDPLSKTELNQK